MVSTVEVYLIYEFQDTSSRGWHLDISNWLDRRLRLFHNRCKSQKMGVGLGLHLSGEESSIQTEVFIAGYSCSSYA